MAIVPVTRPKKGPIDAATEQQYIHDLVRPAYERCSIGGCTLYLYPDIQYHTQRFITEKPTLGSWGVYDWGVMPYEFTLQGTTGISGLHNLDTDDDSIRTIRPLFKRDFSLLDFRYPGRFPGARKVRVLDIQDSRTSQNKFIWYTILLKEYPSFQPTYQKISTTPSPRPDQTLTYPQRRGALVS